MTSYFERKDLFFLIESLYWMKHFSFLDQLLSMCIQCSESLLSTHLPTSEGWTAELTQCSKRIASLVTPGDCPNVVMPVRTVSAQSLSKASNHWKGPGPDIR